MKSGRSLGQWDLVVVTFRSFFLQAMWTYERMQSLGFLFSIRPALSRIYGDTPEKKLAEARHASYFNTHPYLVGLFLGMVLKLEEEVRDGQRQPEEVTRIKAQWAGPLAALGDSFFWATWLPVCSLAAGVLFAFSMGKIPVWMVILGFVVVYNSLHLWIRWSGVSRGYASGREVISWVLGWNIQKVLRYLQWVGALMACVLVLFCLSFLHGFIPRFLGLGLFALFLIFNARGVRPAILFYVALVIAHFMES